MSVKVRDLVRTIRGCKTAAAERSVIARECALIRTSFKEEDTQYRQRNLAKLLLFQLLGYPTQFGQLECLKLIASSKFSDKRIGYLGLCQLLDENSDVLMLVTNSLANDLQNANQYVNGIALTGLANIGDSEMCMALSQEVNQLMGVSNPYIRKKAVLCAVRTVKKVEDIREKFDSHIAALLDDKNHGVLLATTWLMETLIHLEPKKYIRTFRHHTNQLTRILETTVSVSHTASSEFDISGVNDPFLQSRCLILLRLLGKGSVKKSEVMSDVLAMLATNTDPSKAAGGAILFDVVRTIMAIEADDGLRVLGINILGKFLQNKDNNIRYVALDVLQQVVKIDVGSVQRHRNTVLECLKDPDLSIRVHALEVAFLLIDGDNIRSMTKELLNLLLTTNDDFQEDIVTKVCMAVELYAPNRRWQLDSLIRAFCLSGNSVRPEVRDNFIQMVISTPELHEYTVHKLYYSLHENASQSVLVQVAVWCIGEFGDLLTSGTATGPDGNVVRVEADDVLDLMERTAKRAEVNMAESKISAGRQLQPSVLKQRRDWVSTFACGSSPAHSTAEFILMALLKLSTRLPSHIQRLISLVNIFAKSSSIELQQRASEAAILMSDTWADARSDLLDRMPPIPPEKLKSVLHRPSGDATLDEVLPVSGQRSPLTTAGPTGGSGGAGKHLLDLDDLLSTAEDHLKDPRPSHGGAEMSVCGGIDTSERQQQTTRPLDLSDLLVDVGATDPSHGGTTLQVSPLEGRQPPPRMLNVVSSSQTDTGAPIQAVPPTPTATAPATTANTDPTQQQPTQQQTSNNSHSIGGCSRELWHKDGLGVFFDSVEWSAEKVLDIRVRCCNQSLVQIVKFSLEVAVPKYLKLSLQPASGDELSPGGGCIHQRMIIDTHGAEPLSSSDGKKKALAAKLRLCFVRNGVAVQELITVLSLLPTTSSTVSRQSASTPPMSLSPVPAITERLKSVLPNEDYGDSLI